MARFLTELTSDSIAPDAVGTVDVTPDKYPGDLLYVVPGLDTVEDPSHLTLVTNQPLSDNSPLSTLKRWIVAARNNDTVSHVFRVFVISD